MRIIAPVTNYIPRSVLTTLGDLVVRGAALPERLAAGGLDTYFKGQGAGVLPIYEKLALRDTGVHIGTTTRNASGVQVITGVGFQSSVVLFLSNENGGTTIAHSIGVDIRTERDCLYIEHDSRARYSTSYSISVYFTPVQSMNAYISALSSDGFSITWTLLGAAFTVRTVYLCLP